MKHLKSYKLFELHSDTYKDTYRKMRVTSVDRADKFKISKRETLYKSISDGFRKIFNIENVEEFSELLDKKWYQIEHDSSEYATYKMKDDFQETSKLLSLKSVIDKNYEWMALVILDNMTTIEPNSDWKYCSCLYGIFRYNMVLALSKMMKIIIDNDICVVYESCLKIASDRNNLCVIRKLATYQIVQDELGQSESEILEEFGL